MPRNLGLAVVCTLAAGSIFVSSRYLVFGDDAMPELLRASFSERRTTLYAHMLPGMLAMALGAGQFFAQRKRSPSFRPEASPAHPWLGRVYVLAALVTAATGIQLGVHAYGGFASQLGFASIGVLLIATSALGWRAARLGRVPAHVEWMTRSYALVLAFVTIRFWQRVFPGGYSNPEAYAAATWFSFVPNLIAAEILNYRRRGRAGVEPARAAAPGAPR